MKKLSKIIGIAFVAAFAALCLTACGGGSGSASGSAASGSDSAANAYEPIYVVTHAKRYSNMGGETFLSAEVDYKYDEHGNNTQQTTTNINPQTKEAKTITQTWSDFDENGYPGKYDNGLGETSTGEWTIENGRAVKYSSSNGAVTEFTYYDNGKRKSLVTERDGVKSTAEFDENGYQVSSSSTAENSGTTETVWELDDQGHVVSATRTSTLKDGNTHTSTYTVEYDENGNISTVYWDGALMAEFEYQKIDNPSTWAWVQSWNPQF